MFDPDLGPRAVVWSFVVDVVGLPVMNSSRVFDRFALSFSELVVLRTDVFSISGLGMEDRIPTSAFVPPITPLPAPGLLKTVAHQVFDKMPQ